MNKVPVELAFVGDLDHLPSPVSKLGSPGLHCYSRKAINKSLTFQECRCLFFSAHFSMPVFFFNTRCAKKPKKEIEKKGNLCRGVRQRKDRGEQAYHEVHRQGESMEADTDTIPSKKKRPDY